MGETTTSKTGVLIRTQTVDQMVVNSALTAFVSIITTRGPWECSVHLHTLLSYLS